MPAGELKKVLKPVHLWAIAVGLVISGEYFGWNYGWAVAGTVGFLIATLMITVFYVTFIFSFTELTTAIPQAGGPFAYALRALGPWGGFISGFATLVEFVFTPAAIAFALDSYVRFLYPDLPPLLTAMACYVIFIAINVRGIKESAIFSVIVTVLAVIELLVYMGLVAPHFSSETFLHDPMPFGWGGVFAALPFAIWFYLAIEGVAMVAEEAHDPKRTIWKGYVYGILTLITLALGVMILTGGITHWKNLSSIDYPLPEALGMVLGKQNGWTKIFASLGLFGLVASFHGTIIGYSRQIFALARAGYLPPALATVHPRFGTPHYALVTGGVIGIITLLTGTTSYVIILTVLGAVVMYIISMISLFALRRKEPLLERPFRAPWYPVFPAVALALATLCLIAIVWYNVVLSAVFVACVALAGVIFAATGKYRAAHEPVKHY